jgi:hypothetical protein
VLYLNSIVSQEVFNIPFEQDGSQLQMALVGGLRNAQFSNIDLNNDGKKDLFVFDRTGSKVSTFLNNGTANNINFVHAPQYENQFPKLSGWALLHDFNGDGLEDLFTLPLNGISGIAVYKTARENGQLVFRQVKQPFFNTLSIPIESGFTNLYHALTDIPAIIDVDNDGDTDVLTFDTEGGRIVWFNNEAKEKNFTRDTFIMSIKDICYGKVYESMFSSDMYLSKDSLVCSTGFLQSEIAPRHSGSTLTALDLGCDGDKDLLIGDIASNGAILLTNNGSIKNPWINVQVTNFPIQDRIDIPFFVATFLVDVNSDGNKDLIAIPNDVDGGYNKDHVWLYVNKGTNCVPSFQLETKNFLVNQMLTLGAKSNFTLIDINNDGLLDILGTGNGIYNTSNKINRIFYYRNVGSAVKPAYKLEDGDYLKISSASPFSTSMAPHAGDIEGDGDIDLILSDGNGELIFYENKAGKNKPVSWGLVQFPYMGILAGQQAKPQIYDVDGDGLNDILCGKQNNDIVYFKNIGAKGIAANFSTSPTVRNFGNLFKGSDFSLWNSSPKLFRDDKNEEYAFSGFEDGRISLFKRKKIGNTDSLILVNSNYKNLYYGTKSTVEIGDIDKNGLLDLLIGNFRGGLNIYATDIKLKIETSENNLDLSPLMLSLSLTNDYIYLNNTDITFYSIYNLEGKEVLKGSIYPNEQINVTALLSGLYIFKVKRGNQELKFVKN